MTKPSRPVPRMHRRHIVAYVCAVFAALVLALIDGYSSLFKSRVGEQLLVIFLSAPSAAALFLILPLHMLLARRFCTKVIVDGKYDLQPKHPNSFVAALFYGVNWTSTFLLGWIAAYVVIVVSGHYLFR